MDLLATLGMILIVGYLAGSIAQRLKFPRITGYLVVGFLLNPSVLHLVPQATIAKMEIITFLVLGFVSYHIGGGLHFRSMNSLGKAIGWIFLFQVLFSWLLSFLLIGFVGPMFMNIPNGTFENSFFPMALVLGAIACASAPAAIVAIILEGKAKGPVTTTTLAVLALTDAVTVIVFSISMEISQPLASGQMDLSLYRALAVPLLHLAEAALLGIGFGGSLLFAAKWIRTPSALLYIVTGTIVLCIGLAEQLKVSSAIASMVMGVMVANLAKRSDMFRVLEGVTDGLFTIFFGNYSGSPTMEPPLTG